MELKLQLFIFILLVHVSHAVWQRVTVLKGQTLTLSCPITNARKNHAEWKNPEGFVMFFNRDRVLRDKRYSINKLTQSEFTISVSDVTFKDGGNYTCSEYSQTTIEKKVEVTVLSRPRMIVTKHNGETVIKCTAEGTHHPPQISWQIDEGPEFLGKASDYPEGKKYLSVDLFFIKPSEKRVSLKCLVRHPALRSQPLMDFVKIGRSPTKPRCPTTIISSPTAQPQGSTRGRTTVYLSTTDRNDPSTGSSAKFSTVPPSEKKTFTSTVNHVPSTASHLNTSRTSVVSGSTTETNDTFSNETSTTGWTSVTETTVETVPYNSTGGNLTESINDLMKQAKGGSSLLVFLVTCLILCLLVVVIFFTIKLRRAHILWKRENEESVPSEESNKSKSSQEEKNAQAQRRKGLFNTAFTQYVVEEPTAVTSVINPGVMAATAVVNNGQASQAQSLSQTAAKSDIKETEL